MRAVSLTITVIIARQQCLRASRETFGDRWNSPLRRGGGEVSGPRVNNSNCKRTRRFEYCFSRNSYSTRNRASHVIIRTRRTHVFTFRIALPRAAIVLFPR
uniref:Uncharacterized protein n=1 Tax=Sipha flava TaxID=143950 RepID=A0A2S2Q3C6_9HEMI